MPPKCYTWLESCGSQLSDGKNEKLFFCILQSVGFSVTLRTDIFLYTEKLSYIVCCLINSLLTLIAAVLDKFFEHHLSKVQSRNLAALTYRDLFRESW